MAASLGRPLLAVHQKPRVAILSTGDEVAEPGEEPPARADLRLQPLLPARARGGGGRARDRPRHRPRSASMTLHARLADAAQSAEIVLTSGGVSVGDYDLVKAVLREAGGIDFWQVAMQPGRPLAFGRIGPAHFFGLPGNPVASMLTFHLFVRPALWKLGGRRELFPPRFRARALEAMRKRPGRREFKRGILACADGEWTVRTTGPQGSGILTSMTLANCFIVLEESDTDVAPGDCVWAEPFGP